MSWDKKKREENVGYAVCVLMDAGGGIEDSEAITVFGKEILILFSAIESGHVKHSGGRIWVLPSIAMSFTQKGARA